MDIVKRLSQPVSSASLGLFRVLFGIIMLVQWVRLEHYIVNVLPESLFFLKYPGFEWVEMTSQSNLSLIFKLGYLGSILIALGVFTRFVAVGLFFLWGYVFFLDAGHYNNHYYVVLLLFFFFIITDAGSAFSLVKKRNKPAIPYWQLFLFQFQVFVIYFYGGIAKLNPDWLNAAPMRIWLGFSEYHFLHADWIAYFICWFGLVFDLSIGFLLWFKKTRWIGVGLLIAFHISNHFIWNIGIFPWLMIAATGLFFEPDWPLKLWAKLSGKKSELKPIVGEVKFSSLAKGFLVVYITFQLLFPFRHWLFEGPAYWNGYCFRFSWNMLLVDNLEDFRVKVSVPGEGVVGYIELDKYMNKRQRHKMNQHPLNLSRFCKFLAEEMRKNAGITNPELYLISHRSINGRPYQLYADTTVNMARARISQFRVPDWVLPFQDAPYTMIESLSEEQAQYDN